MWIVNSFWMNQLHLIGIHMISNIICYVQVEIKFQCWVFSVLDLYMMWFKLRNGLTLYFVGVFLAS